MKRIIFTVLATLCLLGFSNDAKASHLAGGEIWYEYAGTASHPNRYDVYLIVYRDVSGITLCGSPACSKTICITSSCFTNFNVTAQLQPFTVQPGSDTTLGSNGSIVTPELTDCVNPNSPDLVVTEVYKFYAQVDLPGTCSDITFSFSENARNPSDNLQTTGNLYLEAVLNNTLGHNTSPKFLNPAAKSFCVGTPFVWSQAAVEPDQDSVRYDFGDALTGTCGNTPTPIAWAAGYSRTAPMSTINGINFDHRRGTLRFTASQQEVVVINITIEEFRYDPGLQQWLLIGTSVRDLQVPVVSSSNCRVAAANGPQFSQGSYPNQPVSSDSIKGYGIANISNDSTFNSSTGEWEVNIPVIDYTCFSDLVSIEFDDGVYCETVAPDGSDFRIIGPDSIPRPVTGVIDNCRPDLVTKNIDLVLHKPLDVNGDYFLIIKNGNDGNTLTNKCGFPLKDFYLIIIRVADCPILDYKMLNTSVENDIDIRIDWEADPTSFSEKLFNSWNILRAANDDQFFSIDTVNNVYARTYLDTSLEDYNVDGSPYQYSVQLIQNYTHMPPTNSIRSILLTFETNADTNGSILDWTEYDGWDSASYEVEKAKWDTVTSTLVWDNYEGPQEDFFSTTYDWPNPITEENEGLYAFRVKATEPQNGNNPFVSESNWIYLKFELPPVPEIPEVTTGIIPNVFTPNGDTRNDKFLLPTNTYSNVSVSVYNRWGKLVYEDLNAPKEDYLEGSDGWDGTDMSTGGKLADGTYFYVLDFNDELSGESEQRKGHLNIFTSGTR